MPKPYFHNKEIALSEILRVNHAGEYGAVRIYQGQISASKNTDLPLLNHMMEQEKVHLAYFESQIEKRLLRPTLLLPLWDIGGYMLGKMAAFIGPKTAMLCTEAVEEVINEHYLSQKQILSDMNEHELVSKVEQFRLEELEHHDIAIENGSIEAPGYKIVKNIISNICKLAICLSKAL